MKKILTTISLTIATVFTASAQNNIQVAATGPINKGPITNILVFFSEILGMIGPILVALATLAFFWFLVMFIWKGGEDAAKKAESVKGMGYSILALFVMVSIWGIIGLVGNIFGIGQGGGALVPQVPVLKIN